LAFFVIAASAKLLTRLDLEIDQRHGRWKNFFKRRTNSGFFLGVAKNIFPGEAVVKFHFTNSETKIKTFLY